MMIKLFEARSCSEQGRNECVEKEPVETVAKLPCLLTQFINSALGTESRSSDLNAPEP